MRNVSRTIEPAIILLAKSPVAGRVKTRCCPPCSPEQAAQLAMAALADTLRTVGATTARRLIIAIDGDVGAWVPPRFEVQQQCAGSLGERIDNAFLLTDQPALLIGMDTPQVTVGQLERALDGLRHRASDAVVGPSADGGFWALGLIRPDVSVCATVAMSRDDTCTLLRAELDRRGMTTTDVDVLVDVDDFATARSVAAATPRSGFAGVIDEIDRHLASSGVGR